MVRWPGVIARSLAVGLDRLAHTSARVVAGGQAPLPCQVRATPSLEGSCEVRRVAEGWSARLGCGSLLYLSAVHQSPTQATIPAVVPASSRSARTRNDATLSSTTSLLHRWQGHHRRTRCSSSRPHRTSPHAMSRPTSARRPAARAAAHRLLTRILDTYLDNSTINLHGLGTFGCRRSRTRSCRPARPAD
jgi:hypothetical protein